MYDLPAGACLGVQRPGEKTASATRADGLRLFSIIPGHEVGALTTEHRAADLPLTASHSRDSARSADCDHDPMRVAVIGGTKFVGPVAVGLLASAGHEVAVAHTGAHEHPAVRDVEHLHGWREELLQPNGLV